MTNLQERPEHITALEHKTLPMQQVEFKSGPGGSGRLKGYAATFANIDRQNDVIVKGAFAGSLDFFKSAGFLAIGHDQSALPIASIDVAYEDDFGLWVEADFHSTKEAQDARTVMQERVKRGKTVGLSVGYSVNEGGMGYRADGVRELKALTVYEASFANIPANPRAEVAGVKDVVSVSAPSFAELVRLLVSDSEQVATLGTRMCSVRQKAGRVLSEANWKLLADADAALDALDPFRSMIKELLQNTARPAPAPEQATLEEPKAQGQEHSLVAYRLKALEMEKWALEHGLPVER